MRGYANTNTKNQDGIDQKWQKRTRESQGGRGARHGSSNKVIHLCHGGRVVAASLQLCCHQSIQRQIVLPRLTGQIALNAQKGPKLYILANV